MDEHTVHAYIYIHITYPHSHTLLYFSFLHSTGLLENKKHPIFFFFFNPDHFAKIPSACPPFIHKPQSLSVPRPRPPLGPPPPLSGLDVFNTMTLYEKGQGSKTIGSAPRVTPGSKACWLTYTNTHVEGHTGPSWRSWFPDPIICYVCDKITLKYLTNHIIGSVWKWRVSGSLCGMMEDWGTAWWRR